MRRGRAQGVERPALSRIAIDVLDSTSTRGYAQGVRGAGRTSSVLGGKNSKEKNVCPLAICCCILSMIFMLSRYSTEKQQVNCLRHGT